MATRDIRLPNGKVIQNVPEGIYREDIKRLAIQNGLATPSDFEGLAQASEQDLTFQPAPEVEVSEVEAPEIKEPQVDVPEVDAVEADIPEVDSVEEEPASEEPASEEVVLDEEPGEEVEEKSSVTISPEGEVQIDESYVDEPLTPEEAEFEIPEWANFTSEGEFDPDLFFNQEVLDPQQIINMPSLQEYSMAERQVIADMVNTTVFGNPDWGDNYEAFFKDNWFSMLISGFGKALFGAVGGLGDLIGFEEDNYFNKKSQQMEAIQQEGLSEAIASGDKAAFYNRVILKTSGDVAGNFLLMARLMQAANFLIKGKKLSLLAKGKNYKELFKITSLRSTFMGAYTYLTTTGDQETRLKNATLMFGMSMTPVVTSLSKYDITAAFKDVAANMAISYATRWEDAQERSRVMALQVAGEGATEEEISKIEKEFLISEAIQIFTADAVFGAMTKRVDSGVKLPKWVPVAGDFEFITPRKTGEKVTRAEIKEAIEKAEADPVKVEAEKLAEKIYNDGATDAELAPRKVSKDVLDLETATYNQIRQEAISLGIKAGGKGVTKQKLIKEIIKARKTQAKVEAKGQQDVKKEQESAGRKEVYDSLNETVPVKTPKKKEVVKRPKTGVKGAREAVKAVGRKFMTIDNIADLLDNTKGLYGGKLYEAIVTRRRTGNSDSTRNVQSRTGALNALLKNLKISSGKLNKRVSFYKGYQKLSVSELLGIYAKTMQKGGRDAILEGNFKGDEAALQAAIDYVASNPKLKKVAEFIIADYAQARPRLAAAYARNEGKPLAEIDYYTPLFRTDAEFKRGSDDIHSMLSGKDNENTRGVAKPFTIERKKSRARVNLDLIGEYKRMVDMQEHYIAQYDVVKTIDSILKDPGLKQRITDAYGKSVIEELTAYRDVVANPRSGYASGSTISKFFRKNISVAYLAYNFKTVLKQIPSYFRYMEELGGGAEGFTRLMTALAEVNTNRKIKKFVLANDPVLKKNTVDNILNDFRNNNPKLYQKIIDGGGELGFKAIMYMDLQVKTAGWYSVYKKARADGKTKEKAISLARDATARTQPTSLTEEMPSIYREGGAKWFLQFTNQLIKNTNSLFVRYPRLLFKNFKSAEAREKLAGGLMGMVISGMGIWAIDNGRFPEDEEDVLDAILDLTLSAGTPIGSAANQKRKGYEYDIPIVEGVGSGLDIAGKALSGEDIKWYDATEALALAGVPVTFINNVRRSVDSGNPLDLSGVRKKDKKGKSAPPQIRSRYAN